MMVEVVVSRIGVDATNQSFVIILREKDGNRLLPIWIGQPEAESIVMQMHNLKRVRPLTHDLCKSLIQGLGGQLRRVQITRVEKNTYYAELHIQRADGGLAQIDARPSDSIAIALRFGAPIFAAEALLSNMTIETSEPEESATQPREMQPGPELDAEQLKSYLEQLRPEDFGKFNP